MARPSIDYSGQKFGRLTALEKIRMLPGANGLYYRCLCDCGEQLLVRYANLVTGNTQSCGCLKLEALHQRKHSDDYIRASKVGAYCRRNAKERGFTWNLTREDVTSIIVQPCVYCGYHGGYVGIDRIDNTQGYSVTNCAPCCHTCNWDKKDMTTDQFLLWIERVYEHSHKT